MLTQWQETMRLVPFIKARPESSNDPVLDQAIYRFAMQPHNPGRLRYLYAVIELRELKLERGN